MADRWDEARDVLPDGEPKAAGARGRRECAVDPPVAFRHVGVEVIPTEDDLERASSASQRRVRGSCSRRGPLQWTALLEGDQEFRPALGSRC
jgi:hypothetical protein